MRFKRNPGSGASAPTPSSGSTKPTLRRGLGRRPHAVAADIAAEAMRKDRRAKALELRTAGGTNEQVARELGISVKQARNDIRRALRERGAERVDECRAILNGQLDADMLRVNRMLSLAVDAAEGAEGKTNLKAMSAVASLVSAKTRIVVAKARINGAEAPRKHEHELGDKAASSVVMAVVSNMSEERLAKLRERAAARLALPVHTEQGKRVQ